MAVKRSFRDMLPPAPLAEPQLASQPPSEAAPSAAPAQDRESHPVRDTANIRTAKADVTAAIESVPDPATAAGTESGTVADPESGGPDQDAAPAAVIDEVQTEPAAPKPIQGTAATIPAREAQTDSKAPVRPHYSQLVRKELRVFQDQAVDLKILTMTINANKSGAGERITDNTLVRVAIDLLLERRNELAGTTEAELRGSLNLPPRY